ncbi:MAG: deoxynucleoside kinase [Chitinophagaceae bacterium]|jgi:deoxyguanosine kinase|nr:deoxynucleoside kinase [Chitinophagaceae bacterium]
MKYKFITVEGNIGAGKTTLAGLLSEKLNARLVLEEFADNPFLAKFYDNPSQYAFSVELFFMAERFKQLKDLLSQQDLFQTTTVSDYLFTKCLLFAKVNLPNDEFRLFQRLFEMMQPQLIQPDLLIYLHAPVNKLQENIKKRNRSYEQNIKDDYLFEIQQTYTHYIKQHPLRTLFVDASNVDFLHNEMHLNIILEALERDYEEGQHVITFP